MELSLRLRKIASMIEECENLIDVGTDHAYIPIYLIKNKICKTAIASDINKGPVEKAIKNIKREGLEESLKVRLGGGLTTVEAGEVNTAVIAGMGGNLIRDIIEESMEVFKRLDYAILQPVQNAEVLREYIYNSGYHIIDEEICKDEGKYYEIIKVKFDNMPRKIDSIYFEISDILIQKKHPMIKEYIEYKIDKYERVLSGLKENSASSLNRKRELDEKVGKLRELLKCL